MLTVSNVNSVVMDALENASESIVIYDNDGHLIACNRNFRKLYGYTKDQAKPGTHFHDLVQIDMDNGLTPINCGQSDISVYIEQREDHHKNKSKPFEFEIGDGRWISVNDRLTPSGGWISIQRDITERKKSEETLLQANDLFHVAFEANSIACSITVLETGKFMDVNAAWCQHVGFSKEEAIGKTAVELNIWGSQKSRSELVERIRETPSIQNIEGEIRSRDGEFFNVLMNMEVIFVGGVECLFISSRDITERKRIERAIKISEKRFQVLFENALIGMALIDSSTNKALATNQKYLEIVGIEENEINTVDWRDITHPDDLPQDIENMRKLNSGLIPGYEMEKRFIRPDGSLRWVELFVHDISFDDESGKKQHFVMTIDITEKKDAELALEVSLDRFANFTQASTDWFWELDKDIRFTYISSVVSESTGRSENEYIGKTQQEIYGLTGEEQEAQKSLLEKLAKRQSFRDVVLYRINKDSDKKVWLRMSGQPYFDNDGQFMGYRGSTSDITKQLELEDKLQQSQKMEAVGQLTGGVAHDFNNLLAVIQGNVELISEALDDGDPVKSSQLAPVLKAARRGAELTQSMLAFSRKQDLSPKAMRLDLQVKEMVHMLQRTLGEAVSIETEFEEALWSCVADPGKVENALLNLCINARDAMPNGGTLSISVQNVELDEDYAVSQSDVKPGKYVVLAVSDTGCGIAEKELEHVIEPFYTTKEIGKGTGLGLSMVYGFARQSKGHLSISSELDVGTTVQLYLPFAAENSLQK